MPPSGDSESIDRRSLLRLAGTSGVIGAGSMLAGCTGGDGDGDGESSPADGGTPMDTDTPMSGDGDDGGTPTAEAGDIQTGGTLTVAMQGDFETLNPHIVSFTTGITVCENLSNSLYRVEPDGEVLPDLAAEMPEISDDGTTYTIPIKEGVQFHEPYNRELKAADVVENYRLIADSDYGAYGHGAFTGFLWGEGIDPQETIQETGEYEVTFNLETTYAPFLYKQASMSAFAWFAIVPPEAVEEHGENFGTFDTGVWATGPFTYNAEESTQGSQYVLDANPNYFREGQGGQLPYVDRVVVKIVPEASVRTTQLKSGQVDVDESVPATDVEAYKNADEITVIETPSTAKTSQWLNIKTFEPTSKKKVRQAMMYAMDRESIIQTKFRGHAAVAHSAIPPWHWAYNKDACVVYDQDPAKAQSLLEEAGYGDGFSLKCEPTNQPKFVDVATILQQQYRQVGIDMSVEPISQGSAFSPVSAEGPPPADWHSMIENFTWGFSADDFAYATFHKDAVYNYNGWSSDEASQIMQKTREETDREKRKELFNQFQQMVTDAMPKLFLLWNNAIHGYRSRVHNLRVWPSFYMWWEDVWVEQ